MIITAIPAGFAAGLFGIGGGLITVPILFYIFSTLRIEPDYLMHLAVGTSFGIIIPTSIVSVLTHHQHKSVDFNIVKGYGIFVAIGVILGTILAATLKTKPLILFFTIVVYILAFYLLFLKEKEENLLEMQEKFESEQKDKLIQQEKAFSEKVKEKNQKLAELNDDLSQFNHGVSHDL